MPVGAIVGAAASIGGALIGSKNASKAANAQVASADRAAETQLQMFNQSREDSTPWRVAGGQAIGQLSDMLQPGYDYTASPGYQFRFGEGQRAVESGAAARGTLMSGGTLKDLVRFGDGVASQDFNQQFNRVASVASGGQQANQAIGALGANAANNIGNAQMQAGNARASGYAANSAAWGGALNNLASIAYPAINGGG